MADMADAAQANSHTIGGVLCRRSVPADRKTINMPTCKAMAAVDLSKVLQVPQSLQKSLMAAPPTGGLPKSSEKVNKKY